MSNPAGCAENENFELKGVGNKLPDDVFHFCRNKLSDSRVYNGAFYKGEIYLMIANSENFSVHVFLKNGEFLRKWLVETRFVWSSQLCIDDDKVYVLINGFFHVFGCDGAHLDVSLSDDEHGNTALA